jgi:hypothetical protein
MLAAVCLLAILLFAYMWMREAQLKQQKRGREEIRRRLAAELSDVSWDETEDSAKSGC